MLGVASPSDAPNHFPPQRDPKKQTMLGVAPAGAGLELANLDDEVESDSGGELELGAPPSAAPTGDDFFEVDLPSPAPASSQRRGGALTIDLPSMNPSETPESVAPDSEEFDLDAAALPELPEPRSSGLDLDSSGEANLPDLGPAQGRKPPPRKPPAVQAAPKMPPRRAAPVESTSESEVGLPDLGVDLPDLDVGLPDLGGDSGLPSMDLVGFPESPSGLPAPVNELPDLGASQLPSIQTPPDAAASPFAEPHDLSSEADFGQTDPFASPQEVAPAQRSVDPTSFGEVDFSDDGASLRESVNDEGEFDAFPIEDAAPAADPAGGGEGYGDVSLEGAGDALDLGDEPDRGGAPAGPAAAASAAVDLSAPARPEKYSSRKDKKKRARASAMSKGTKIAVSSLLGLAVCGGALASLLPEVGPYGAYFIVDQMKAGEYQSSLVRDTAQAQKKMGMDTSRELGGAFQLVNAGLADAPRYKARIAYAAYVGFFHQLRFGAASDESAQAHALMDSLKEVEPGTQYLELAQLAQKAATGHPEVPADQAKRLLGRGLPFAVLVGESALAKRKLDTALQAWTSVASQEDSARSHFGLARTRLYLGEPEAAITELDAVLAKNPKHVGARILQAQSRLKDRTLDDELVSTLVPLSQGQDGASRGEQVEALIVLGQLHLTRARLKKAEGAFTAALSANAGSAAAQRGLAQVLFESGRYSEALARYESALSVEPAHLGASLGVVQCKLQLEQLDDAVKVLDALSPKHPKSSALQYWLAVAKEAVGDKEGAQAAYSKAIDLDEPVAELVLSHVALTRLLSQKGEHLQASKVIEEAEEKFPQDPAVFEALGELAASRGSFDDAISDFDKAITLDPKNIGLHFLRGISLRQARRFEESRAEFDLVEKESKDYPGLALERGNLFEASGRSEEALKAYEQALADAPDDLDLKLRVACGKANAGQSEPVIEQLKPLLEARPSSAEVNFCQGLALLNGEEYQKARVYLERAVSRDPSRAKHHLYVGWVNLEMGDLASANRALDQTIKLDSTLADAYWKRGELRVKQRAVQDALIDLDRALKLAPSRTEAHAQKALALLELGKEQEAMAEFKIAVNSPVAQPAWHYRYGDLLLANRRAPEARKQLEAALDKIDSDAAPVWAVNAHRLLALSIGRKKEALEHWQSYVNAKKGTNDPYLSDAAREMDAILRSLGH